MTFVYQAQFLALSTIFYTLSMPTNPKAKFFFLKNVLLILVWPKATQGKEYPNFPQCLSQVPQSEFLLCRYTFPVIKDVMQVLAFSKLHLFSKGISGRHVTGLIPLALSVGAKALPDPQGALCGVLWAGGVAGVTGMVASWRQLGV